jgi:hypothetical protein
MRVNRRLLSIALASVMTGGLLLALTPTVSAQRVRGRVVFVAPGPYWGGFYPYGSYPYGYYPYPPDYLAANFGEVKLDTHLKDAALYVDGGYAAKVKDAKKFALRPGNHEIEVRNSDGQTIYKEQVAVLAGHTTKLHIA